MVTSAPAQSASDRYPRVASPIHTILVLVAIGAWAIGHKIFADHLSATANPNRMRFYAVTLFYEWALFVLVVAGAPRSGGSVPLSFPVYLPFPRPGLRGLFSAAAVFFVSL